jgi:phospholipid transport system transporter-binding protein
VLTLPAVLTHAASAAFARGLPQAMQSQPAEVVADASALQQFDSSALAVLLECRRQALAAGKTFSVHGAPARLLELAGLYGVEALISPAATAAAVAAA